MNDQRYTDTNNVVKSLQAVTDWVDTGAKGRLTIVDAGLATVVADTREQLVDRNVWGTEIEPIEDNICTLKWHLTEHFLHIRLVFHETVVEEPLTMMPAGHRAIDADQATDPTELGPRLREALEPLVEEFDPIFNFAGVEAASAANGGHLTDFEYEYTVDGVNV